MRQERDPTKKLCVILLPDEPSLCSQLMALNTSTQIQVIRFVFPELNLTHLLYMSLLNLNQDLKN